MTIFQPSYSPNFCVEFKDVEGSVKRLSLKTSIASEAKKRAPDFIANWNSKIIEMRGNKSKCTVHLSRLFREVYQDRWIYCKDTKNIVTRSSNLITYLNDPRIDQIGSKEIVVLRRRLRGKGLKAGTINRYLALLKTALNEAIKTYSYLERRPHIKLEKEPKSKLKFVSKKEEKLIIELSTRQIMSDLIVTLIDTGMRLSEALRLEADDINLEDRMLTVWVQKGIKPRSIPMTSRVYETLMRLSSNGMKKPFNISFNSAMAGWRSIARKAIKYDWFDGISYHTFRHTCASRLVQSGVDLYVVKEILGHESISTTQRYAHLRRDNLIEAIKKLE